MLSVTKHLTRWHRDASLCSAIIYFEPGDVALSPDQKQHDNAVRCNHLFRHLIIDRQPVRRNLRLSLLQRNRPRTNLVMQIIFDLIFLMEAWLRTGKLWP